jgi:hypothetical protein
MSRRLEVLQAVKDLVVRALPGAQVIGLEGDDEAPVIVPDCGRVIVRSGDPGEPEVDLSPRTYWYEHRIPLEVTAYRSAGRSSEEALDEMLTAIGAEVDADRELGGLAIWTDTEAPTTEDLIALERDRPAGRSPRIADLVIVPTYGTRSPLA